MLKNQLKEKWFRCITMHVVGSVINCLSDYYSDFQDRSHIHSIKYVGLFVVFFICPGLHSLENLD